MRTIILSTLMVFGYTFFALGQPQLTPSQSRFRVGVSYDKINNQFGVSFIPKKNKKIYVKYELGFRYFNLRDEDMEHDIIYNYYVAQKMYETHFSPCLLCWLWGGGGSTSYERIDDKILVGKVVKTYKGFYPKVAIPLFQTFYLDAKKHRRIEPLFGIGWGATYTKGLSVFSTETEIKEMDNTLHAEIVRMKQVVRTKRKTKLVIGMSTQLGLRWRVSDYYFSTIFVSGFNVNPITSSIDYISFDNSFHQVQFLLSKDF